jgi:polyhydroxyalkanoate synthesis regulator phasin
MPEEVGNQEESGKLPGVTPEATEKVEQIVKKAIKTVVEGGDLEDANATLFGEAIIEYLKLNETEADLKSYWKKNQEKLDSLKVTHPTLYGQVKSRFTAAKEKLKSKETT